MTEKEKLAAGQWYDPGDHAELSARRRFAQRKCFDFNHTDPEDHEGQRRILKELLGSYADTATIMPGFICDYGWNIHMGEGSFTNFIAYLMDCAPITLGDDCWLGVSVTICPGATIGAGTVIGLLQAPDRTGGAP